MNNGPRYQATTDRNKIGHRCCYLAAVVDTDGCINYEANTVVCETGTLQEAVEIADALNARAMQYG